MFSRLIFSSVSLDIDVYSNELLLFLVTSYFFDVLPLTNFCLDSPISIFRVTYKIKPKLGPKNRLNMSFSNTRPKFLKAQINVEGDIYTRMLTSL